MDFITVFTAFNLAETQLIRSRLEAADFHPVMVNEYQANMFGGSTNACCQVFVQVPKAEAAEAKEFLKTPTAPAE